MQNADDRFPDEGGIWWGVAWTVLVVQDSLGSDEAYPPPQIPRMHSGNRWGAVGH
jgi:hypothetical protein